jgi:hypothetical protein
MRKFDKTKNILKANLLNEQRHLESKGLIKEGEECIEVAYSLDELMGKINESGFDLENYLIYECFDVIFKNTNPLYFIKKSWVYDNFAIDPYNELPEVVKYKFGIDLSSETIKKLIILFIIEENSSSLSDIIYITHNNKKFQIDTCKLQNYISLHDIEDGNIIGKLNKRFIEKYKDLV